MKTQILSAAALAAALGLSLPMTAEAAIVNVETNAQVELVRHDNHNRYNHGYSHNYRHSSPKYYRGHGYNQYRPPSASYRSHQVRPWSYWQPYAARHHYHSFGQPVYYASHPSYGPYYRVRAHDRSDVALWLGISAITGAILFSNY
ncbi:MAG: hypothetical protein U0942_00460 [Parvibaculum sp.]|uniref:hypothetical protein n=1 Tax=Parvibaculum sp. TaxID=2024848 RepID=UPI002AB95116|nr:hypothetical protein [Parvibaculum sp.]MDZ4379793.1 hypothetical protein [Parvibaculum sp.]